MEREQRLIEAIKQGYKYNSETGIITGKRGNEIKSKNNKGYIRFDLYVDGKTFNVYGHHFAFYYVNNFCPEIIDHKNRERSDNKISNLREATHQQNQFNKDVKGYSWNKKENKFQVSIKLNYKHIHLGWFKNEQDAINAYAEAKIKYHTF